MSNFGCWLGAPTFWALLLIATSSAWAQEFSADLKTLEKGQTTAVLSFHLNISGNKIRMEPPPNGMNVVVIADKARNTTVALIPEKKLAVHRNNPQLSSLVEAVYVDNPQDACPKWQRLEHLNDKPAEAICSKIGPDKISGRDVIKYRVRTSGEPDAVHWVDPKLKVVIKSQSSDGRTMFLDNIQEVAQPADLFSVPSGYHELEQADKATK